ncbi:hypothetical protein E5288_WYG005920 [Bos mutus]|uniref:Uncharacterized protein n=1 Tax=Bos mutus TaxID=72004 RepID=A0A6B0QTV2_9CETA|nr:hypothetical protein [Bos mutus]
MQCKVYNLLLALPQDPQATRTFCIISLPVVPLGLLVYLLGAKCTPCMEDKDSKACLVLIFQIIFVISVVLTLITGSWTAHTIIRNFYNALVSEAQKRELRASVYLD